MSVEWASAATTPEPRVWGAKRSGLPASESQPYKALFDETGPALVRWFRFCAKRPELVRRHLLPSLRDGSKASLLVTVVEYEPAPFESFTHWRADLALMPSVGLFAAFGAEIHGGVRC